MDDDDYQRIADYENEIYDLNHEDQDQDQAVEGENVRTEKEADQRSESITTSGSSGSSEFESLELSDESDSDDSAALSGSGKGKAPQSLSPSSKPQPNTSLNVDVPDMSDEDSSGLSEDERDMIYSRLYHTNTALPFATEVPQDNEANSPSKRKTKKNAKSDTDDVPSSKFTFDLDLDNLSPPPEPTAPITETPTLASDDDEYPMSNRGRYFAPAPERPSMGNVVCFRCNQSGHFKADCPVKKICRECNALDDHSTFQCPTRLHCSNCSQNGHTRLSCPFITGDDPSEPCRMCGDYGHIAATCHQIWRYYRPVEASNMKKISNIERYCYNCARKGHFGDDCPRPRPYYVQGGRIALVVSAFGEGNVPEWAKLKPEQIGKRKASPIDDEEDGWFENQAREPPKPVKKVGGIKLNKNEKRDAPANSADSRRSNNISNRQPPPSSRPLAERLSSPRRGPPPRDRSPIRPKDRDQQSTIDSYRPSYRPRPEYRTRDDIRNEREWEYEASRWRQRRDEDREGSRRRDHRR